MLVVSSAIAHDPDQGWIAYCPVGIHQLSCLPCFLSREHGPCRLSTSSPGIDGGVRGGSGGLEGEERR